MPASVVEAQPRASAEFVEYSVLEAVVPGHPEVDIQRELDAWDGKIENEGGSVWPFLSQRHVLLLDEVLPVYVVFRTPVLEDEILKSYLARLVVNIEAFAFSTAPSPEGEAKTAAPKEVIYSSTIKESDEPTILRHGQTDDEYTYVIWRVEIFISRPQARFHKPAVYFQPLATFKPAEKPKKDVLEDEYLPSRAPTALNLLQAFDNDPALAGIHPRLSALRINKIAPSAQVAREMARPIRNCQRPIFRVLPPLIWRMRYSRIQTSLSDLSLMAALDLEIAQFATYDIRLYKVALELHGGSVRLFTVQEDMVATYKPGDQLTYLYKIKPDLAPDGTPSLGNKGHFLTLNIDAQVFISKRCKPKIAVEWQTPVDFTNEQTSHLIRTSQRLSASAQNQKAPNPDALPAHDTTSQQDRDVPSNDINITLTVSGPPEVHVGETFNWDAFLVNRSDRVRKLAVRVLPKRKMGLDRPGSRPSTAATAGHRAEKKDVLATAVVDENVIYAKQKSARTETAELICLTTDIRLGQLAPGACYTANLEFLPLSAGVLSVDSIRVVDLATNETADIRDLPSIVAVEKQDATIASSRKPGTDDEIPSEETEQE